MRYTTEREVTISNRMKLSGIHSISDLSIENLCALYKIDIKFQARSSYCIYEDDYAVIFMDNRLPFYEQRRVFFHELAHYLFHHGNQRHMPKSMMTLQEEQARFVSRYIAMPRHIFLPLVHEQRSILDLQELFQLPEQMIVDRCHSMKRERTRSIIQTRLEYNQELNKRKSLQAENIYDGTREMLHQLASKVGEESISYDVRRLL
ncbi:ImmA/IrrE family metallo-endopeptidase [Shouchella miscanthi]|uniref:ImmA/IrrE family metallo-endopeptidase n=1 Tax=Shouchella miscanthi TaxID=2598861 RepID=UPI0011A8E901|nr:ImmA/IrrE family metallo-endopeptidase [Shouchella miscanthi]